MGSNLYSTIGIVSLISCFIIFHCNRSIHSKNRRSLGFSRLLILLGIFFLADALWGFFYARKINFGVMGLYISSWFFHALATSVSFGWYMFTTEYFEYKDSRVKQILISVPYWLMMILLVAQFFNGMIFTIGEDVSYHTQPARTILFVGQFLYFILALIRGIAATVKTREKRDFNYVAIVTMFLLAPIVSGIFQLMLPDAPYYSIGFLITSIIIFDGTMVIDKSIEGSRFELVSKETYKALSALCKEYLSVHLFDLKENKQVMVNSTPQIEFFVDEKDNAHDQIKKVMEGVSNPDYTKDIVQFVDTYTLAERMKFRNSISMQFVGRNVGWCCSSFIVVERDEYGDPLKVIHSVQCIEEAKKKEAAYTAALTRAYENKNAIYAEIMKMQSVGVIATDESERLIIANDMAAKMFGHKEENVKGMTFTQFWESSELVNPEETTKMYMRIKKDKGAFSYNLIVPKDAPEEQKSYLMAEARVITLLDGSDIMITCYTDITKSKRLEEKLRVLSEIDALTQIDNRRSGERRCENLIKDGIGGLYCLVDVNDFKQFNDSYGHQVGDEVLVAVSKAIKETFRSDDIVMRLGGDEFAIYAKNVTDKNLAVSKIEKVFEKLENIKIEPMKQGEVCISLGAVLVTAKDGVIGDSLANIYRKADSVMYSCKGKSGNNMKFYEE